MREIIEALVEALPPTNMAAYPALIVFGLVLVVGLSVAIASIVSRSELNEEYDELLHPRHDPLGRR